MNADWLKVRDAVMSASSTLRMRLARPNDAGYIYSLRTNTGLNEHLSAAPSSVDAQAEFIKKYMQREEDGREYYFVIQNRATGADCGTVRIYDLQEGSFCWGSWILDSNKPRLAALESAIFVYDFGFGLLGFPASHFDVRRSNKGVISFHQRFGAQQLRLDEANVYFSLRREELAKRLEDLTRLTSYAPVFLRKEQP